MEIKNIKTMKELNLYLDKYSKFIDLHFIKVIANLCYNLGVVESMTLLEKKVLKELKK